MGMYFISHTGGHKYTANVIIYQRRMMGATDGVGGDENAREARREVGGCEGEEGAVPRIWLARVKPEDCKGIVKNDGNEGEGGEAGEAFEGCVGPGQGGWLVGDSTTWAKFVF